MSRGERPTSWTAAAARWLPGRTLRSRLVWSTTLFTLVAMGLMTTVVALVVVHIKQGRTDDLLQAQVSATTADLQRTAGDGIRAQEASGDLLADSVWVFDRSGNAVVDSPAGPKVRESLERLREVTRSTRVVRNGRVFLAEPQTLGGRGAVAVVVAAERTDPTEDVDQLLVISFVVLGVIVTAGTALVSAWTVGRTLRPVLRMTRSAAEWSERDLETRFDLGDGTDEFTRLGNTLDSLLDRVAQAIRNEQLLTSELAHELRTPLTAIRAEAELGQMGGVSAPTRERLERVVQQVDRLTSTINTLLALARTGPGQAHRCDVVARLERLLDERGDAGVDVHLDLPDAPLPSVGADGTLVDRVLGPVLENALRYAAREVRISVRAAGGQVVVRVEDDGPGVATELGEDVFVAGVRSEDSQGAGLGLSLASRVAESIGARIALVSPSAPTTFEVRLPRR